MITVPASIGVGAASSKSGSEQNFDGQSPDKGFLYPFGVLFENCSALVFCHFIAADTYNNRIVSLYSGVTTPLKSLGQGWCSRLGNVLTGNDRRQPLDSQGK